MHISFNTTESTTRFPKFKVDGSIIQLNLDPKTDSECMTYPQQLGKVYQVESLSYNH